MLGDPNLGVNGESVARCGIRAVSLAVVPLRFNALSGVLHYRSH
jgi:hypothetical protein